MIQWKSVWLRNYSVCPTTSDSKQPTEGVRADGIRNVLADVDASSEALRGQALPPIGCVLSGVRAKERIGHWQSREMKVLEDLNNGHARPQGADSDLHLGDSKLYSLETSFQSKHAIPRSDNMVRQSE
jgi:hypothetical protein